MLFMQVIKPEGGTTFLAGASESALLPLPVAAGEMQVAAFSTWLTVSADICCLQVRYRQSGGHGLSMSGGCLIVNKKCTYEILILRFS